MPRTHSREQLIERMDQLQQVRRDKEMKRLEEAQKQRREQRERYQQELEDLELAQRLQYGVFDYDDKESKARGLRHAPTPFRRPLEPHPLKATKEKFQSMTMSPGIVVVIAALLVTVIVWLLLVIVVCSGNAASYLLIYNCRSTLQQFRGKF